MVFVGGFSSLAVVLIAPYNRLYRAGGAFVGRVAQGVAPTSRGGFHFLLCCVEKISPISRQYPSHISTLFIFFSFCLREKENVLEWPTECSIMLE